MAYAANSGDKSFSKRLRASVKIFRAWAVFRTDTGSKLATSKIIFFVLLSTSAIFPPFIPATPNTFLESAIIISLTPIPTSLLSRVVICSPVFACLTIKPSSANLSKSKTCAGWPVLNIKRFAASTILLMLLCPIDSKCFFTHSGLGPTFILLIILPMYRLHKDV